MFEKYIHGVYEHVFQKFEENLRKEIVKMSAVKKVNADLILLNKMPFNKLSIDLDKAEIFTIFTKSPFPKLTS